MSEVMKSIGNIFSSVMNAGGGKLVPGVLAGAGTIGNFLQQRKQQQAIDQQMAWNKYVQGLVSNPGAFSKFAQGFTQPLTAGLTTGVENQAQAWLAEHGLSQSPAIAGDVMSQALAPYIQQQQQFGVQEALNALSAGGGTSNLAFARPGTNLTDLLKLLMNPKAGTTPPPGPGGGGSAGGQGIDWGQIPDNSGGVFGQPTVGADVPGIDWGNLGNLDMGAPA